MASLVEYEFDDSDADAIRIGLVGTDVERDKWFAYPLGDVGQLPLRVASDPGSSVTFVEVEAKKGRLAVEIETVLAMAQHSRLVVRNREDLNSI
ncbi:MAG: hypothetical protein AAGI91_10935 [Bacteroidota bacterium]